MTKREKLIELIQEMSVADTVSLHNEYCYETNCYDNEIFDADRLDEICEGQSATWIMNRVHFGDYHPQANYIKFNGYGNFQSIFDYEIFEYIYEQDIVDYILEHDTNLNNDDIQEVLDNE